MFEKEKRRHIVHFVGDVYFDKPNIKYIDAEGTRKQQKSFLIIT
ncbi:MAG: hypothetical protein M5T52_17575 [Ignavibacteriaceae bacterium]|nr:hypothetical protein [Ignavibacteriaceae bacterium]